MGTISRGLFRQSRVLSLSFTTHHLAAPQLHFGELSRRRFLYLSSSFRGQVLPLLKPEKPGNTAGIAVYEPTRMLTMGQMKQHYPNGGNPIAWTVLENLFSATNPLGEYEFPRDGRVTYFFMGGSAEVLVGASISLSLPSYYLIRAHWDRSGLSSLWYLDTVDDVALPQPCEKDALIVSSTQ